MATQPDAQASIEINAPVDTVFALVSDPLRLTEFAVENTTNQWLGGAREAKVGARFKGANRNGRHRWSTVATITELDEGRKFGFAVHAVRVPISRWEYEVEPTETGCRVTERTWNAMPGPLRRLSPILSGEADRNAANQAHIEASLANLKALVE